MSYKTNQWEDGLKWNGVVFPATTEYVKPFEDAKNPAIRPVKEYEGEDAGDIIFDLSTNVRRSRALQMKAIAEIDRIKKVDVPWKAYLTIYVILIILAAIGSYVVGMFYRVSSTLVISICIGYMVSLTIMFFVITFFGFKAEEEQDVEKLCHFYNLIKKERKQQDNFTRMSYKLAEINWGRDPKEIDGNFLFRVNQIRGQSNMVMNASSMVKGVDVTAEMFTRLHTRMHEILFENSALIKRTYGQISSVQDWQSAKTDKDKLFIMREVFQMHLVIRLFASKAVTNYEMISRLAGDNLCELVQKCNALIEDDSFKSAIAQASGCDKKVVDSAFSDIVTSPGEMTERLVSLNQVFTKLIEKFPKRLYERVKDTEIGDQPADDSTFTL